MRFRGSIPREWAIVSGLPGSRLQHPGAECFWKCAGERRLLAAKTP